MSLGIEYIEETEYLQYRCKVCQKWCFTYDPEVIRIVEESNYYADVTCKDCVKPVKVQDAST